jgi:hypothetical protein
MPFHATNRQHFVPALDVDLVGREARNVCGHDDLIVADFEVIVAIGFHAKLHLLKTAAQDSIYECGYLTTQATESTAPARRLMILLLRQLIVHGIAPVQVSGLNESFTPSCKSSSSGRAESCTLCKKYAIAGAASRLLINDAFPQAAGDKLSQSIPRRREALRNRRHSTLLARRVPVRIFEAFAASEPRSHY